MTARTVKALHAAHRDDIADLVTRRPLPGPGLPDLDPFLFLNHHGPQVYPPNNRGLPFGPHPHRGFETVTFILEGELAHHDSGGHASVIRAGGVQWMTAGSGLIHAELSPAEFKRQGGPLEILQLWVNLPARLKMTPPRYQGLQAEQIPTVDLPGAHLQAIAGEILGVTGAVETLVDMTMATVALKAQAALTVPIAAGRQVFLYVARGEVAVAGRAAGAFQLVELNADGDVLAMTASRDSLLILGHAAPFREPIFAHGPFVMNTREEIIHAIADYQRGKFGPAPAV
jgi:redox-sensitive bicupin YhaK (pirin superfamily)